MKLQLWIARLRLRFQESQLIADLALAAERRREYRESIDNLIEWEAKARERLREVRARLAAVENPRTLLDEALSRRR